MAFRRRFLPALLGQVFPAGAILLAAVLCARPPDASAHTIRIAGTGSAIGTMQRVGEAFRAVHPDARVRVFPSLGSAGGIEALLEGRVDVAVSARPLIGNERARGARQLLFARTALVFAAHNGVMKHRIAIDEVADIYGGRTVSWRDGRRIRPVLRPSAEADIVILKEISPRMRSAVERALAQEGIFTAMTDQDAADAIERIPGAFGTTTLALVLSEGRSVRIFRVDGVEPSVSSLAAGAYPYVKSFYLICARNPYPVVRRFVEFLRSPAARRTLLACGCLPVR
jgi:phosphate transport system substrate-binding protein